MRVSVRGTCPPWLGGRPATQGRNSPAHPLDAVDHGIATGAHLLCRLSTLTAIYPDLQANIQQSNVRSVATSNSRPTSDCCWRGCPAQYVLHNPHKSIPEHLLERKRRSVCPVSIAKRAKDDAPSSVEFGGGCWPWYSNSKVLRARVRGETNACIMFSPNSSARGCGVSTERTERTKAASRTARSNDARRELGDEFLSFGRQRDIGGTGVPWRRDN